ncbi:cation-translocating P-type ATPase [Nesterenkonia salmonea]|uniref:Cation-translocating P-type ATPase n=1 Tax=Nesterenkonia salmonea TaxID=1804987 RepID=A0A5R9B7T2_9MICC|nr:cation-translocating P-type ATPase [Nesterenkonia salmonea]TLP93589.1 cation-translocating P-type ATPase [Nesterenkonia salmonea]
MSVDACGCASPREDTASAETTKEPRWWGDRRVLIPLGSGLLLGTGWVLEWSGLADQAPLSTVTLAVFWVSLLFGASQFVPGALRALVVRRRLGIGLLMTISATGAVALGYIEEAAALAFLYSIAEALEDRAMDKARSGLRSLLNLLPASATIVDEAGDQRQVPASTLVPGQLIRVAAGERLATDGVVRTGRSALDTSAITGESIPVEAGPGDEVLAGSINTTGVLEIEATAPGSDNSLTTVVQLVEQAQAEKGERARLADRIARPLVPGVLLLAILIAALGSLFGDPMEWVTRAIIVLVAASPCALAISVPITVVSAIGGGSKHGVIVKSGAAFEQLGSVGHVAFDKTGTLTRNRPTVNAVLTVPGYTEQQVLDWAAALEAHSTHPLAAAITHATAGVPKATEITEHPGQGITGVIGASRIAVGSPRWLDAGPLAEEVTELERQGNTVVITHHNGEAVGAVGVRDELREEAVEAIQQLARAGVKVTMLTGDNTRTAHALAAEAGITDVRAELRPEDKAAAITELRAGNRVAMIGDGINDAPALAAADIGIAMGATGSDAAVESADVAFTGEDIRLIPQALAHARRGRMIINQNIILSLTLIAVLPLLALFGVIGLAAVVLVHELAEVVIILNGLRAARTRNSRDPSSRPVVSAKAGAGSDHQVQP